MHTHRSKVPRSAAARVNAPIGNGKTAAAEPSAKGKGPPERFTYALAAYTAERRKDGWFIAKTVPNFVDERPKWSGPFETVETACLSIGRHLAVEIADRHTRSVEWHKIGRSDPLYGLKPTTKLSAR
jgi:hypothetical protein